MTALQTNQFYSSFLQDQIQVLNYKNLLIKKLEEKDIMKLQWEVVRIKELLKSFDQLQKKENGSVWRIFTLSLLGFQILKKNSNPSLLKRNSDCSLPLKRIINSLPSCWILHSKSLMNLLPVLRTTSKEPTNPGVKLQLKALLWDKKPCLF